MMRKKAAAATIRGILSAAPCPISVQTVAEVAGMDVAPTAEFLSSYHRQLKVHKTEDGRYVASDSWRIAIPEDAAEDVKRFLREHGPGNRRELSEGLFWVRMDETSSAVAVFFGVTRWMLHRGELREKPIRGSRGTVYYLPDQNPHTKPEGSRTLMDKGRILVKDFRNAVAIGLIGQKVPSEPPRSIRRPVRPTVSVNPTATDELMTALCTPGSPDPTYD